MVFKRKIYDKLKQWKELSGGSSAVLLEGARRIGKSTIVEEFARNEYDDYMILDFAKEGKDIKNIFSAGFFFKGKEENNFAVRIPIKPAFFIIFVFK